jgi:uncharacterized protein (TIGR00369 family)
MAQTPETPDATALAKGWFEHSPFINQLGLKLVSIEPDRVEVELPYKEELATAGDVVHGGVVSSLIDTAAALAAWSGHDVNAGTRWGTVNVTVNFLAAGQGSDLTATATVSRRGRSLCYCRVEVADAEGKPVAEGLVTYRLG